VTKPLLSGPDTEAIVFDVSAYGSK